MTNNNKMTVVESGNSLHIYTDDVKAYKQIPAGNYIVRFHEMRGFWLDKYDNFNLNEHIYGVHDAKAKKVLRTFSCFDRSLGVILSGDKGIGKSLFAKLLSKMAIERGWPVIIVDKAYPGIANYIESIKQEVVILFDEFDKTFGEVAAKEGEAGPQAGLLTLFDGLSGGKKLFIITCNSLYKLNEYLINRPGRFHYHFRFEYPTPEETKIYLNDKVDDRYKDQIEKVVEFSNKVQLNYDCLRAIATELNMGESFSDAISDLNIIKNDGEYYDIIFTFANGDKMSIKGMKLDFFNEETVYCDGYNRHGDNVVDFEFSLENAKFDINTGNYKIDPSDVNLIWRYDDEKDYEYRDEYIDIKAKGLSSVVLKRRATKNIHYTV